MSRQSKKTETMWTMEMAVIPILFSAYAATQTGYTGAMTDIDMDTELFKDEGYTHAAGDDNVTLTPGGVYQFSYTMRIRQDDNDRACVRVFVFDDGAAIAQSGSSCYLRYNTYGHYNSVSCTFPATIGAGSIIDLRTEGQANTGAFGSGCNYAVMSGSVFSIKRIR